MMENLEKIRKYQTCPRSGSDQHVISCMQQEVLSFQSCMYAPCTLYFSSQINSSTASSSNLGRENSLRVGEL